MNALPASPRPHHRLRALCAALIAVLVVLVPALPATAAEGDDVTWTVRTASNNLGSERTNFTYTVDPGGAVSDALVVANHGAEPVDLKIYASDGFTSEDGQLSLLVAGEESHSVGAWIAPQNDTVTIAGGQTATIPFTVTIPENATPGDYAGGVVTSLAVPDASTGVNVDRRLGIRVNLRVGGELAPAVVVEDMSVSWNGGLNPFAGGDATMTYTLHNTGNASISAQPEGRVTGPFGMLGIDVAASDTIPELLPGESWTQTVTVPGVPPVLALFATANVTPLVVDASGSTSPIAEVTATAVGAAIPWTVLIVLALLAAAAYLLFRRRGRRRADDQKREDARIEEAVAQALEQERTKIAPARVE
ncbi:COG1470 family protein [Microbacterium allomyrinae]|uniref:DUF916 domain-containing protein n=1 Tax=Microbacterium allomyrinae TaxID=2830666 RepID=A0A9X1LUY2_9MICO|nr:DUF916 domain-containing protein [Microbacterium allomyrinae]MCC2032632.1 DUF916 domain-containing protein [Microbacterium allomyrinae]